MVAMRRMGLGLLALLVVGLLVPGSSSAHLLQVGDPIPAPEGRPSVPIPGTWKQEPLLSPDPAGGPPWAIGSFLATNRFAPPGLRINCIVIGRFYAGEVGQIDAHEVFHPYAFGAGSEHCGGTESGQDRGPWIGGTIRNAIEPDEVCYPAPIPGFPDLPVCDQANVRTLLAGILGTGVIDGWVERDAGWRPMYVTRSGAYLVPLVGSADGQGSTRVRLHVHNCGPLARPFFAQFPGAVVNGCVITIVFPFD